MSTAAPPPPSPPPPPMASGGGASEWCKAAVVEGQTASAYAYPYGQYDAYSSYTYAQPQETQTTTVQQETDKKQDSAAQPPPPPPPPLTAEQQQQRAQAAQAQAWAQYHQQYQAYNYPSAYANPQAAYGTTGQQQAYYDQQQAAYYAGAYTYPYGYGAYAQYPQYQQQQTTTQQQRPQAAAPTTASNTATTTTSAPAYPSRQTSNTTTLTDPRLRANAAKAAPAPTSSPPKAKSRFSAARQQQNASSSSDSMDIDDEGPTARRKEQTPSAPVPPPPAAGAPGEKNVSKFKLWVERCFLQVKNDPAAEARLKPLLLEKMQEYSTNNLIRTRDWDKVPPLEVPPPPSPRSPSPSVSSYSSSRRDGESRRRRRSRWETSDDEASSVEEGEVMDEEGEENDWYGPYGGGARGRGKIRGGKKQQQQMQRGPKGKKARKEQQQKGAKQVKGGPAAIAQYEHDKLANLRRLQRFTTHSDWKPRRVGVMETYVLDEGEEFDPSQIKPIIGTCEEIDKEYFRLNEVPAPEAVRPERVLRQALARIKARFAQTPDEQRETDYKNYLWTQLKAIRQDLLVQHLRNDLAVEVYETHARIALECRDMNEYNQCQTQLMEHYRDGLDGSVYEFHAYRLLYYVYLQSNPKYQDGDAGIIRILGELTPQDLAEPAVAHALKVRKAVALGNYHALGKLYLSAPNMGSYIMDHFMDQNRVKALQTMMKGYRFTISRDFVLQELALSDDVAAGVDFLKKVGVVFTDESETVIDAKQTKVDSSGLARRALM